MKKLISTKLMLKINQIKSLKLNLRIQNTKEWLLDNQNEV